MPLPPDDAADPKQAVEARLCAYLEGDLAGDELAQIERHVAANPQHRKLLAELTAVRAWTRQLPREPAPPDLAEAFQQQVERAMLLDPAGDRRRPSRARAFRLAALLLLAVGLAAVAAVLSRTGRLPFGRGGLAIGTSPAAGPAAAGPSIAPPAGVGIAPSVPPAASSHRHEAAPTIAPPSEGPLAGVAAPPAPKTGAGPVARVEKSVPALVGARAAPGHRLVTLVAVTPNPTLAITRATDYLRNHNLSWDDAASRDAPPPPSANAGRLADANGGEATPPASAPPPTPPSVQKQTQQAQQQYAPPSSGGRAADNANNDDNANSASLGSNAAGPGNASRTNNAATPTARPPATAENNAAPRASRNAAVPPPPADAVRVLYVRDLSPEQAAELTALLSAAATVHPDDADRVTQPAPLPATTPAADPRRVTLVVEVRPTAPPTGRQVR